MVEPGPPTCLPGKALQVWQAGPLRFTARSIHQFIIRAPPPPPPPHTHPPHPPTHLLGKVLHLLAQRGQRSRLLLLEQLPVRMSGVGWVGGWVGRRAGGWLQCKCARVGELPDGKQLQAATRCSCLPARQRDTAVVRPPQRAPEVLQLEAARLLQVGRNLDAPAVAAPAGEEEGAGG